MGVWGDVLIRAPCLAAGSEFACLGAAQSRATSLSTRTATCMAVAWVRYSCCSRVESASWLSVWESKFAGVSCAYPEFRLRRPARTRCFRRQGGEAAPAYGSLVYNYAASIDCRESRARQIKVFWPTSAQNIPPLCTAPRPADSPAAARWRIFIAFSMTNYAGGALVVTQLEPGPGGT